jgi:hypothetical protein
VLLLRPGIWQTLTGLWYETFTTTADDSVKKMSYQYRGTLWHVAYSEVKKSPERFLFGYGGLTTETMDLSSYFSSGAGGTTAALGYTSWDNQMACDLIEFGYVGFLVEIVLLGTILASLIGCWLRIRGPDRTFVLAMFSASCIYIYALSNVYMFSPHLKCLFWSVVACGIQFGRLAVRRMAAEQAGLPADEAPPSMANAGAMWST